MIKKYRKKPIAIEAVKLTEENYQEVMKWCGSTEQWSDFVSDDGGIVINTLEGDMEAKWGDYIIKEIKGDFYPCKPDIFDASYEEVEGGEE